MAFPNRADYITFEHFGDKSDAKKRKRTIQLISTDIKNENNFEYQLKKNNNNVNKTITFEKNITDYIPGNYFGFTNSNEFSSNSIMGGNVNQFGILKQLTNENRVENNDLSNNMNVSPISIMVL